MSDKKETKYALPIGTVLKNPKKWGEREYSNPNIKTIEF